MTDDLRWRFLSLQAALVVIFAFSAGFLFWASGYSHSTVHDELAAQQITFPAKNSAAIKALPAANARGMNQYGGQTMINGDQARTYANNFIKIHLNEMGMTYSQVSAKLMANPKNAKLQQLDATIFKGASLRSMLLNAYGWWTVGTYAGYAAFAATLAAIAVFFAFLFEATAVIRKRTEAAVRKTSPQTVGSPAV